jgi:hypothetical protein
MSPTTTTNVEHLTLDGPVGLTAAILIGLGMLVLFAWALRREQNILGKRNTALFWLLRTVAVVTVIWMLLAPNSMRVQTSTTRKAVAIVTDVSGSMQTIDPAGTAEDLRWTVADQSLPDLAQYTATSAVDSAIAAVGIAQRHLQTATAALKQHKPESTVVEATTSASNAIQRAKANVQLVENAPHVSAKGQSQAHRLLGLLDGSEFEAFEQLCVALQKNRTPSQKGWRESLPDLEHRIAAVRRSLHELARQVATDEASRMADQHPAALTTVRSKSRLSKVATVLDSLQQNMLTEIREKADIRLSSFDQSLNLLADQQNPQQSLKGFTDPGPQQTAAVPTGTNMAAALEQLNRERQEQPLAAVIMLTDAAHNQTGEASPREVAATLNGTPVYIVPIGNTQHVRDVVLQSVYAPAVAMRNDDIVIEASLQAYDCASEVCVVQLMQDGEVIDFREVTLDSEFASRTVRFDQHVPAIGNQQFQVAIVPLDGELTEDNNYDDFEVNVTRSDIKVLLADELPRWEYRYLTQLFRRDNRVECDELLFHPRMIATGHRAESRTFPVTVDDWDLYDVVMLGDLSTAHLPVLAQETLIQYLQQRGGTLVMIAGPQAMPHAYVSHPLQDILPVLPIDQPGSSNGYAFRVTEEGQDHQALMIGESEEATRIAWDFVNRFSPLHEVSPWRQPRPTAHTLISAVPRNSPNADSDAENSAFLCWQPVGRGRIIYLSGPDTYRLRFLRGDRLHYRFWGQLLRWAIASDLSAGSEFVRIRTDKSRYDTREEIQVTVQLTNAEQQPVTAEALEIRISSGNDDERTVPLVPDPQIPGSYQAAVRTLPPGIYRVEPIGPAVDTLQQQTDSPETPSASFTVQADLPLELVDTRSDRALAQQITDMTGGQVLTPSSIPEVLQLTNLDPLKTEQIAHRPLWLEWKYLWLVFGCLQTEWIIRKWKGLS